MNTEIVALGSAAVVLAVGTRGHNRLASTARCVAPRPPQPVLRNRGRPHRVQPLRAPVTLISVAITAAAVAGPFRALFVVAAFLLQRRVRPVLAARRRRSAIERSLPDAFDFLVLGIRSGLTPQQAIRELAATAPAPVRPAFVAVAHRCDRGQAFAEALGALPEILGPRATALADVIASSDRYGLPLGPVLDQLSAEAREARHRIDQADARTLPVRLSFPLVVCTLPSFVLLAIAPAVIAALSSLGSTAW